MKLVLLDQGLAWRGAAILSEYGFDAVHVSTLGRFDPISLLEKSADVATRGAGRRNRLPHPGKPTNNCPSNEFSCVLLTHGVMVTVSKNQLRDEWRSALGDKARVPIAETILGAADLGVRATFRLPPVALNLLSSHGELLLFYGRI